MDRSMTECMNDVVYGQWMDRCTVWMDEYCTIWTMANGWIDG